VTATTYTLKAIITADISFYTYNGNNGVALENGMTEDYIRQENKRLYS
jgi:hypothetical protein